MARTRILFVSDLHKACKEMSTIRGRLAAATQIQQDIIDFNQANNVTHMVILGDWYHRGYQSTMRTFNDYNEDRHVSESVNGNVYLCIGNHFFLERDDNPEMYIIQPCEHVKPAHSFTMPEHPIFQVVKELVINNVKISFFHYNKVDKTYVNEREDSIKYHIGIYHDDAALPSWVREKEGYSSQSSNDDLNRIYANVDLAIHGHVHTKIDPFKLQLNNGTSTAFLVPGSLGVTQNKESMKHPFVNLPLIDINDDGSVALGQVQFSTHLEMLKFYKVERKNEGFDVKRKSAEDIQQMSIRMKGITHSLPLYLTDRGLPVDYRELLDASIRDELNVMDVFKILGGINDRIGNGS